MFFSFVLGFWKTNPSFMDFSLCFPHLLWPVEGVVFEAFEMRGKESKLIREKLERKKSMLFLIVFFVNATKII